MENTFKDTAVKSWMLYDWANSAFATTVMTVFMPVFYIGFAGKDLPSHLATAYWGYTLSFALLIAAIISPILGALADLRGSKKRFLGYFVVLGVTGTALLYFVGEGEWLKASIFFIFGNVGFAGANVFYDSLLPHIAKPEKVDRVSARGFAMGYLGGGIILAINLLMILSVPEDKSNLMIRLAFISVAIWWLVFSIPLFRNVSEPPATLEKNEEGLSSVVASFRRLKNTFQEIKKYREVLKFLVALLIYTDAIGTIVKMGVTYASEIGIQTETIVMVVLMIQFVSIPFSFIFGWLAEKIGTKNSIYLGLLIYTCATIGAYFMATELHLWIIGFLIAMTQGGTSALTRSLGARMIPKSKSGEFFGFVSVMIKFGAILGPLIFGLISQLMGSSRLGFLSLTLFFLLGIYLLSRVDEQKAIKLARAEE